MDTFLFLRFSPHKVDPSFVTWLTLLFVLDACIFFRLSITFSFLLLCLARFSFFIFLLKHVWMSFLLPAYHNWSLFKIVLSVLRYTKDSMHSVVIIVAGNVLKHALSCNLIVISLLTLDLFCPQVLLLIWPWSPLRRPSSWLQMTSSGIDSPQMGKQNQPVNLWLFRNIYHQLWCLKFVLTQQKGPDCVQRDAGRLWRGYVPGYYHHPHGNAEDPVTGCWQTWWVKKIQISF